MRPHDLLDVVADHTTATIVGSVLLILGVLAATLWLAGTRPTGDGAHEGGLSKLELQQNAMQARIHAVDEERWQGATLDWSPKAEMPAPQALAAHLSVYELERIAEAEFEQAREKLGAARRAIARFEMERDAAALRQVETDTIQKIRWTGYDPEQPTQEVPREFLEAVRR